MKWSGTKITKNVRVFKLILTCLTWKIRLTKDNSTSHRFANLRQVCTYKNEFLNLSLKIHPTTRLSAVNCVPVNNTWMTAVKKRKTCLSFEFANAVLVEQSFPPAFFFSLSFTLVWRHR